jgi:hypothetical protein
MQTEGSAIGSVRRPFEATGSAQERENGNLSYCDLERAFPIVNHTNKKQKEKNL